jgi:hypothetical protein
LSTVEPVRHLEAARERLDAAAELLRAGFPSDAASRVYYAFFHAAQALARIAGASPKTHRGLLHALGEHYGSRGRMVVQQQLPLLRAEHDPDLVIANAENARSGSGHSPKHNNPIRGQGIDALTLCDNNKSDKNNPEKRRLRNLKRSGHYIKFNTTLCYLTAF